jgi:small subunit ribosomal protein S25
MKGLHPVRRTLQHLNATNLILKPFVRILAVHYQNPRYDRGPCENHAGAREFVFWHLAQLQYKNPQVQILTLRNLTPTPFIRVFFDGGRELLMDIDRQSKDEIQDRVVRTLCKTKAGMVSETKALSSSILDPIRNTLISNDNITELEEEQKASEVQENPAHFGYGCRRHCMCEIPGQIPCPGVVPLPYHMRGKYRMGFAELDESKYV